MPDGRRLGYAVYGAANGKPILFFHGIPGSRLQRPAEIGFLSDAGYCVYALDRPGIGLSDAYKNQSIRNWAEDVRYFCRYLDLHRIIFMGVSGGGPYALCCGVELAAECSAVIVISSLAPLSEKEVWQQVPRRARILFFAAKRIPSLTRLIIDGLLRRSHSSLEKIFAYLHIPLPEKDRQLLSQPAVAEALKKDVAEAFRQGSGAIVTELAMQTRPWGCDLQEMSIPVYIWHGTDDTLVPPTMAEFLAKKIPHAKLHWIEHGGHFIALEIAKTVLTKWH